MNEQLSVFHCLECPPVVGRHDECRGRVGGNLSSAISKGDDAVIHRYIRYGMVGNTEVLCYGVTRERVTRLSVESGAGVGGRRLAVRLDDIHTLVAVGVVYRIACPEGWLVIDAREEHAASGYVYIPTCALPVLQKIEHGCIGMQAVHIMRIRLHNHKGLIARGDMFQTKRVGVDDERRCHPAHIEPLVSRERWRSVRVVVVQTIAH